MRARTHSQLRNFASEPLAQLPKPLSNISIIRKAFHIADLAVCHENLASAICLLKLRVERGDQYR